MSDVVIGIDLGTTYSVVSVYRNGSAEIIANNLGQRTTPSYVAFTESERLIGNAAKNQQASNVKNTIFDIKRIMGLKFNDPALQEELKHLPYKVINKDNNNLPYVEVTYKGEIKHFSPEEISSMILGYMKEQAENYLGHSITKAVITVPARFSDAARQATKIAAEITSLEVLRIINEPTAASLAYNLNNSNKQELKICICDIGGK